MQLCIHIYDALKNIDRAEQITPFCEKDFKSDKLDTFSRDLEMSRF